MIINERDTRNERVLAVGQMMMTAARTAPKGKGLDIIEVSMVTGKEIQLLSEAMVEYSSIFGLKFLLRDAQNILQSEAVVLIGTKQQVHALNCGYCGFSTCEEKAKYPDVPCAINSVDVGIALGSACSVASDCRVDSRVMFSAGRVAKELNWLPDCSTIFTISISCSSKSPFFDRVSHKK